MRELYYTDLKEEFVDLLHNQSLFPVIGSGFTMNCRSHSGVVPSGAQMKSDMISFLVKANAGSVDDLSHKNFSNIALYYNRTVPELERKQYLRDHFTEVEIVDERRKFLRINWKYIYTLNIDDGIEKNSSYTIAVAPMRELTKELTKNDKVVIKIHGDADEMYKYRHGENFSILDTKQYISSLRKNTVILSKLQRDFQHDNIIFVGCSLDDEVDLLSVFNDSAIIGNEDDTIHSKIKHHYYLTHKKITPLQLIDLESFGIDTIVYTNTYEEFYSDFALYAEEADSIPQETIDRYSRVKYKCLNREDPGNAAYLFYSKKLYQDNSNTIVFPYFMCEREINHHLLNSVNNNNVVILCGTRVSGKSYCLARVAESIKNRTVYYFDSRLSVKNDALKMLLEKKRAALIFDTTVLDKNCVRFIIRNIDTLQERDIHVLIAINRSDRDIISFAEFSEGYRLEVISLPNRFTHQEYKDINDQLAKIPLLPFNNQNATILDNLRSIGKQGLVNKSYNLPHIYVPDEYTLALYILLATYEKVDDQQLIDYSLTSSCQAAMRGLEHEIIEYYLFPFERSIENNSAYRIVCNAQFWLFDELGHYSLIPSHHNIITSAYRYLVAQGLNSAPPYVNRYKAIEELIKFDTLNTVFHVPSRGNRNIIYKIYDCLSELLSSSYQYHHQYAKCLLWMNDNLKENKLALRHASIALHQVNTAIEGYEKRGVQLQYNHPLHISRAHIIFTLSLIYSSICLIEKYENIDTVIMTIDQLYEMVCLPLNNKAISDISQTKKDRALLQFVKWATYQDWNSNGLGAYKKKVEKIISSIFSS